MLGLETMDGSDVVSVASAMSIVREVGSPWLQVYPDLGNLAANGIDVEPDLATGEGHIVGVHLKDSRPGEYRRVPFGDGIVPFVKAFSTLDRIGYDGPIVVEMWNDSDPQPMRTITLAREWIEQRMAGAR
jgi:L-ribulose-5-phosphate 3-epimerase